MTAPGTFRPSRLMANIETKHLDLCHIQTALCQSPYRSIVQKYARIFGFNTTCVPASTHALRKKVGLTIDDCLGNNRPHLNAGLWQTVIDFLTSGDHKNADLETRYNGTQVSFDNLHIPRMTIAAVNGLGINLPAFILIMLINYLSNDEVNNLRFFNADGNSFMTTGILGNTDTPLLSVVDIYFDHDFKWFGYGFMIKDLPSAVIASLENRKVSEFIEHPFLEGQNLTINDVYEVDELVFIPTDYKIVDDAPQSVLELAKAELAKIYAEI